jgi:virulence factor Mce-like protein
MADSLSPVPRRLLGLAMIGLVVALLGLCVAVYNKAFTADVPVTMEIAQADNSFLPEAEVRMRGVTVGRVSDVASDGSVAKVTLSLQPEQVASIPRNVLAQLLPKSLFGERYVSLVNPPNPARESIRAGDVITRDRSSDTTETEQVFKNLLPLLEAVQPKDLANTLGAVDQALRGRGGQLGDTIERLHDYLSRFNPALPDLTEDIRALPRFSDTYAKAAPDLLEGLDKLNTTSRTLVEKRSDFEQLYSTLTQSSDDLREFLKNNQSNFIHLVSTARPTLALLARYSPEYVCLFKRLSDAVPEANRAFGLGDARPALHVTADIVVTRGKFLPHQDEPEITDNRGPACYDNSYPLPQYPGGPAQDGSTHPPAVTPINPNPPAAATTGSGSTGSGSGGTPSLPGLPLLGGASSSTLSGSGPGSAVAPNPLQRLSTANSAPERRLVSGLVTDMSGDPNVPAPAWSSLLVGPLLRGAEVQVR